MCQSRAVHVVCLGTAVRIIIKYTAVLFVGIKNAIAICISGVIGSESCQIDGHSILITHDTATAALL